MSDDKKIILKTSNLKLNYLDLKYPNFSIKLGDFIILRWKSWIWKTSLLKSICWLENNFSWELFIEKDILINYVFDNYLLIWDFTVVDNLKIENSFKNLETSDNLLKKIDKYLSDFNILNLKDKLAKNLSSGEKQKIKFIRSILNNPKILILDEPTSHLDEKNVYFLLDYIINLSKTTSIIFVSHNEFELSYLKNKLKKGIVTILKL